MIIELEDGTRLEFPDGTSDADIGLAVEEFAASAAAPAPEPAAPAYETPYPGVLGTIDEFVQPYQESIRSGVTGGLADEARGLGAGVRSLFGGDQGFGEAYAAGRDELRAAQAAEREASPVGSLVAEAGGSLITAPFAIGRGLSGAAATGGALGGLYGFGGAEGDAGEIAGQTALGAGLGAGLGLAGEGAAKLFRGVTNSVAPVPKAKTEPLYREQVDLLTKEGLDLLPGQKTGSTAVKLAEETNAASLVGGDLKELIDNQETQLQSVLMKKAGFTKADVAAGKVTDKAVQRAQKKFSKRYDDILGDKTVKLKGDDEFEGAVEAVQARHLEEIPSEQRSSVANTISDLQDLIDAEPITGERYQRIRSIMAKRERKTANSEPFISDLYGDLAGALDDAFQRNVDKVTGKSHKKVQRDYRNFTLFREAIKRSGHDISAGDIPLGHFLGARRSPTKDFSELVRAGQSVLQSGIGRTGTAERLIATNPLSPQNITAGATRLLGPIAGPVGATGRGVSAATSATAPRLAPITSQLSGRVLNQPDFEPDPDSLYGGY